MSRRSGLRGLTGLRKKLRQLDPEITKGIKQVLVDGLQAIETDAKMLAPYDEGDLRRSITYTLSKDGLAGVVGPGGRGAEILRRKSGNYFSFTMRSGKDKGKAVSLSKATKHDLYQMFKGYWLEFGTKGRRAEPARKGKKAVGAMSPVPARPFMQPAFKANASGIVARAARAINAALDRATNG